MINNEKQSLAEAEHESSLILNRELDVHLNATQYAYNLLCLAIEIVPEIDMLKLASSFKVAVSLLVKISNDIRCASLMSAKGYSIQSASIVASMYESSFMVAYIGSDEERARKWIQHNDPKKPFIGVFDLTKGAIKNFSNENVDDKANKEYSDYRQLCMVKHSNPLIQMQHGFQIEGNNIISFNGPDHSETSIRVSWFALERSINYILISVGSFINNQLTPFDIKKLVENYKVLESIYQGLNNLAIERWGSENP